MSFLYQIFKWITVIHGIAMTYTGAQSLFDPVGFAAGFGLPIDPSAHPKHATPSGSSSTDLPRSFAQLVGARQLATGLIGLTFAYQQKWSELATMLSISGVVVAGMDGVVLMRNGYGRGGISHAIPGVIISAIAMAYLWA